jgi:hypothetical protein
MACSSMSNRAVGLQTREFLGMCDYSLQSTMSRPAKVGDKLTTRNFGTGTRGFAAPEKFHDGGLRPSGNGACFFQGGVMCTSRLRWVE